MGEMIKMVLVLTVLSIISGGSLSYLEKNLKPIQEKQIMQLVKGPAVRQILQGASNKPVDDVLTLGEGKNASKVFYGVYEGKPKVVVMESEGKGYGGPIGLLVAIDMEKQALHGIGVTTHTETGGLGAEAKDNPEWAAQFTGKSINKKIQVTGDGGEISAIGGATITSRAVCDATNKAVATYQEIKPQLTEKLQGVAK
ncbi:MAG: RnfABCDGE type electron transport complex subunit G [Desulfatitalea sp.]|nr:RnfABCDGE type electron transport complex subunit G [Desulfatitalea sp.]